MADPKTLETYLQIPMRGRMVSGAELALRTGKTTACIYKWERLGKFPQRIKLADRAVAWKGDEVADWFDALGAEKCRGTTPGIYATSPIERTDGVII